MTGYGTSFVTAGTYNTIVYEQTNIRVYENYPYADEEAAAWIGGDGYNINMQPYKTVNATFMSPANDGAEVILRVDVNGGMGIAKTVVNVTAGIEQTISVNVSSLNTMAQVLLGGTRNGAPNNLYIYRIWFT